MDYINMVYRFQNMHRPKFFKFLGWFFLILGIIMFITEGISLLKWHIKKENYTLQYVYSDNGILEYELNNKKIYMKKIYNTYNEQITPTIPDKKTIIIYCENDNPDTGIYFDLNNSNDSSLLNPVIYIFSTTLLIGIGLLLILIFKPITPNNLSFRYLSIFSLSLLIMGSFAIVVQVSNAVDYWTLKSQNNITYATVYSEIYLDTPNVDVPSYIPVSYYYVDDKKYIYVESNPVEGSLVKNLNTTFTLYYDSENPYKVIRENNPVNIKILVFGIFLFGFSFPILFFRKTLEKRQIEYHLKQENNK